MKIQIKPGLGIGEGCKPFIIAEIGSNWLTREDCLSSIVKAKTLGADAVKFQAYNSDALYGPKWFERFGFCDAKAPGTLPLEWLPKLKDKSDACGIEFMCSAFSPELVDAVNPYVNIHKVASAECTHKRILEKLRKIGKPVILSTGGHGIEDVRRAIHTLGNGTPVALMYCVAAYPADEIDLGQIKRMRDRFRCLVGYSDHSLDYCVIPQRATELGACIIEKHVTFVDAKTPDAGHSLNAKQFKSMVDIIRGRPAKGFGPTESELPMILRHNRRLIATCKISPGDILSEGENFGIYRSLKDDTHAFSPFMVDEVNGRVAKRDIAAGDGIGPGDC